MRDTWGSGSFHPRAADTTVNPTDSRRRPPTTIYDQIKASLVLCTAELLHLSSPKTAFKKSSPGASISGLSFRTKLQGGGGFCKQVWLQKLDQLLRKLFFTEQCVAMRVGYSPRNRSLSFTVNRNLAEKWLLVTKWSWAGFLSPTSVVFCVPLDR